MSETKMNRAQWVELFHAIGLDEAAMRRWHAEFERRYPAQHQSFLEWIDLSAEEIVKVRTLPVAG
ncbi:MAG: hypothetical protein KGZ83_09240 [Sulfuricella sp.]|nr:hypothetical protein [Sulfuricella sp.]